MWFFRSVYSARPMSVKIAKCFIIMVLILLIPRGSRGIAPGPPLGCRPTRARGRASGPRAFKEDAGPLAPFGIPPGFPWPLSHSNPPPPCVMIYALCLHGSARLSFYWSFGVTVCMPTWYCVCFLSYFALAERQELKKRSVGKIGFGGKAVTGGRVVVIFKRSIV